MYRAGMVLAAVHGFGTDVSLLVELSGQPEAFVRGVLKRARATRLLVGQTLRVAWNSKHGIFALAMDSMVAEGSLYRPPDPKRSAAAKARPRGPDKKPRARRNTVATGVYTPKMVNSNPLYGLAEWEKTGEPNPRA